jgi:hypothetical protein
MVRVDFWKAFSEGSGEPDSHIVESQNDLLDIGDDPGEGFLVDLRLNLPVVAITHSSPRQLAKLYPVAALAEWRGVHP